MAWVNVTPREMTTQEKAIWNATFAACFVAEFRFFEKHQGFDAGCKRADVERATTVADCAVVKLRLWNESGNIDHVAGKLLAIERDPEWG